MRFVELQELGPSCAISIGYKIRRREDAATP